jgi:hypothetical protein
MRVDQLFQQIQSANANQAKKDKSKRLQKRISELEKELVRIHQQIIDAKAQLVDSEVKESQLEEGQDIDVMTRDFIHHFIIVLNLELSRLKVGDSIYIRNGISGFSLMTIRDLSLHENLSGQLRVNDDEKLVQWKNTYANMDQQSDRCIIFLPGRVTLDNDAVLQGPELIKYYRLFRSTLSFCS